MRRLAVTLSAVALGAALFAQAPVAQASVFDFVADALTSQPMHKVPGDTTGDKPRSVFLNGFPMYVQSGRSSKGIGEVLDYYRSQYQGGALKQMAGRPIALRHVGNEAGTLLTVEVPDKGTVMEMFDGKRPLTSAGPLRMVYARRTGVYTDYLTIWSDKAMPPAVMQPVQSGDAPGQDLPGIPRPVGARTFSFTEPKAGYALAVYKVAGSADEALRNAALRLHNAGWSEDQQFAAAAAKQKKLVARFSDGKKDVVVTSRPHKHERGAAQLSYLTRDLS